MIRSDKLFSDFEVPIQNVITDKIDKVFKLAAIDKFAGKASWKTFYNKPGYKKKNMKAGLCYKKKQNQKKSFKKSNLQKQTNFVHGTSSE
ncbi:hypothetical protein Hanom_Chr13g01203501 [Helianthus anomalus]